MNDVQRLVRIRITPRVSIIQPGARLGNNISAERKGQGNRAFAMGADQFSQIGAVDKFHDDIKLPIFRALNIIKPDDVMMIQARDRQGFGLEHIDVFGFAEQIRRNRFNGYRFTEQTIAAIIDDTKPSSFDFAY
ncbi:MAG: hypothetical protein ALAOOOJD_04177 [bacterium]|nr:hypothetical protein [bacterium]